MTEAEWRVGSDPTAMFQFLRTARGESRKRGGRRRLRLFGCACVRGIWELLRLPGSRQALYYAERFVDGLATEEDLATAGRAARTALANEAGELGHSPYWQSAEAAGHIVTKRFDEGDHPSVAHAAFSAANAWALHLYHSASQESRPDITRSRRQRQSVHAGWLRDIFGNPFCPVTADPRWLTSDVVTIAGGIYESRDFSTMPILADALQDAGCENADVLGHCRDPQLTHVRGCWVVDLVLGKA